jgi:hypothetical protein
MRVSRRWWYKTSTGPPSSCRDEKLTICRAKKWVNDQRDQKLTRRFFNDATVETAMMSSIDYKYTTINNFDENIRQYCDNDDKDNDSLAKARQPHCVRRYNLNVCTNIISYCLTPLTLRSTLCQTYTKVSLRSTEVAALTTDATSGGRSKK